MNDAFKGIQHSEMCSQYLESHVTLRHPSFPRSKSFYTTDAELQTPTQARYPLALHQRWSALDLHVVQRLGSKGRALLFERDDR